MDRASQRGLIAPALILGGCMMVGLVVGCSLFGAQIKAIRLADRYVTVKGLVERTVKSESAIWPVTFKEAGNDLPKARRFINRHRSIGTTATTSTPRR